MRQNLLRIKPIMTAGLVVGLMFCPYGATTVGYADIIPMEQSTLPATGSAITIPATVAAIQVPTSTVTTPATSSAISLPLPPSKDSYTPSIEDLNSIVIPKEESTQTSANSTLQVLTKPEQTQSSPSSALQTPIIQVPTNNNATSVATGSAITVPKQEIPTKPATGSAIQIKPQTGTTGTATGGALTTPSQGNKPGVETNPSNFPNVPTGSQTTTKPATGSAISTTQENKTTTTSPTSAFVIRIPKNINVTKKQQDLPIIIECNTSNFKKVKVVFGKEVIMTSKDGKELKLFISNHELIWTKEELKKGSSAIKKITLSVDKTKKIVPGQYTGCFTYQIKIIK